MSAQHHAHEHEDGACSIPHFHNSQTALREDILSKTKELADLISTSSEVDFYKKAETQVSQNDEIQNLIKLIKKKQKEAVAFESFQNPKMVEKIEGELNELQDQLDQYPIVNQFKQAQDDINYMLQLIINVIRESVSDKINVEAGSVNPNVSNCSD